MNGGDECEAGGFLPSEKTACTPPQAKAQSTARTQQTHNPPHAPHPLTRVKKPQVRDFTELEDGADDVDSTVRLLVGRMAPITAKGTRADGKGAPGTPTTTGTPAKSPICGAARLEV